MEKCIKIGYKNEKKGPKNAPPTTPLSLPSNPRLPMHLGADLHLKKYN